MTDTPRSDLFDDVYFSAEDGPAETHHVFLEGNNLPSAWQGRPSFHIAETGFGTGLNFLLTWALFDRTAPTDCFLDYVSIEKYPLTPAYIKKALSPWAERLSPYLEKLLASYPLLVPGFHRIVFDQKIALTLIFDDVCDALPEVEGRVDAWFLDGFTPSKNPQMWTPEVFTNMARLSHAGTTFSTFTAAGAVRRGLEQAGFQVEKVKGFGAKRHSLKGVFTKGPLRAADPTPHKEISILGAGLAGTAAANILRSYGFHPVLYDPNGIAGGASGNRLGIINPRLSAYRSPESDFYTAGFAQAIRSFSKIADVNYRRCGSLHLITDDEKHKRFSNTKDHWGWQSGHMALVDHNAATDIAGVDIIHGALYLPDAGYIDPYALCHHYAKDVPLRSIYTPDGTPCVYANAMGVLSVLDIPIHTVRGQISMLGAHDNSRSLRTNLNYGGYLSAYDNNAHVCGSTFQKWLSDTEVKQEDHDEILARLHKAVPSLGDLKMVTGGRASLRVSAKDRFPIAGEIPGQKGGYISTAHGSHGLVSTLAIAHMIADSLRGGVNSLSCSSLLALNPLRFNKNQTKNPRPDR